MGYDAGMRVSPLGGLARPSLVPALLLVFAFESACGGGPGPSETTSASGTGGGSGSSVSAGGGGAVDTELADLIETFTRLLCEEVGPRCRSIDAQACRADVVNDFDDARASFSPDEEAACAACLQVKIRELEKLAQSCGATVDDAAVLAACDLDTTVDADGNGRPDDDDDDACGGAP